MLKKVFISLFLTCAAILIAGTITLKVMFPSEKIKKIAKPKISEIVQRDIEIEDASFSVFPSNSFTIYLPSKA